MIFAPERMVRMEMLALSEDVEHLTGLIAGEGSLHIVQHEAAPRENGMDAEQSRASDLNEITRLNNLADEMFRWLNLSKLEVDEEERRRFLDKTTHDVLEEAGQSLEELRKSVSEHLRQRQDAEGAVARLDAISEQMNLLNEHDLSFRDLQEFKHFFVACGNIERSHTTRFTEMLEDEPCGLSVRPAQGQSSAFLLIGDLDNKDRFNAILKDSGANTAPPPDQFIRSFEEGLEQVEIELWQQRDRLAELAGTFEAYRRKWHKTLSNWRTCLQVHGHLHEAMSILESDGAITLISGYLPSSSKKALIQKLESEASGRYFAHFEPVEKTQAPDVPTRLRNKAIFRPFEFIVKTYGLPGYNDIDPTPLVAISFLAMFGMMFGDVGHGLVLAGIGACVAYLPYRIFLPVRDLGRVLVMAGLSGMLFGFLFGSVFGIEEDSVLPALWMRPSHPENLMRFLTSALILGVIVLSAGIILGIIQALRKGNMRKALFGQWSASSLAFFWALLLVFGMKMTGKDIPLPSWMIAVALAIPLFLIAGSQILNLILESRHRRGVEKEGRSEQTHDDPDAANEEAEEEMATILFEPIEILMNLFTNSVSFLRVAAFGLAHAALTMAAFTVNDMVRLPGASVFSLPLEHLFIIVLEGMIVTIQCLRMEYYEFFSKFFAGNGVAYTPLSIRADETME